MVPHINMFKSCAASLLYNEILPKSTLKSSKGIYILNGLDYNVAKGVVRKKSKAEIEHGKSQWFWKGRYDENKTYIKR